MEEVRIDVRKQSPERLLEQKRSAELCFKINHTMPTSDECKALIDELFNHSLGEMPLLGLVRSLLRMFRIILLLLEILQELSS